MGLVVLNFLPYPDVPLYASGTLRLALGVPFSGDAAGGALVVLGTAGLGFLPDAFVPSCATDFCTVLISAIDSFSLSCACAKTSSAFSLSVALARAVPADVTAPEALRYAFHRGSKLCFTPGYDFSSF